MSMYRSNFHNRNQNKRRRKRKIARLILVNSTLLVLITIIIAVYTLNRGDENAVPPDSIQQQGGDSSIVKPDGGVPEEHEDLTSPQNNEENGPSEMPAAGPVKLSFVGDILLASKVDAIMNKNGYDYPYKKAKPYLEASDLTAANLENPITRVNDPAPDKQFVFKGDPVSLPSLKAAGFDVVSLANNHTQDHGKQGLLDTMHNLDKAGIPHTGGGRNDVEAFKPVILEAKGIKVAYFGFSRVLPVIEWKASPDRIGVAESYDEKQAVQAIRDTQEKADLVVVMVHWGRERVDWPVDHQKVLARAYIDAGADLVIGSHPHVLQGFESYKGKWIAYSLGNFIFNTTATKKTRDTGVLDATCTAEGACDLQLHPMRANNSQPVPLKGAEATTLLNRISDISIGASIDSKGRISAK